MAMTTDKRDLADLTREAIRIRERYDKLNVEQGRQGWTKEDVMLGFVGDVGDLSKLVMAAEGIRGALTEDGGPDSEDALRHELADCLWSVLVLARLYNVDIEAEFDNLIRELDKRITAASADS